MQIVIGLFDEAQEAERAIQSLRENGYDGEITMLHRGDIATAWQTMTQNAIPDQDAIFFMNGLYYGGSLVIVLTNSNRARVAADILSRFNMVDIDARLSSYTASGKVRMPTISEGIQMGEYQVQRGDMLDSSYAGIRRPSPLEEAISPLRVRDERDLMMSFVAVPTALPPPTMPNPTAAIALLRAWRDEDEATQRASWEGLRETLGEDRLSERSVLP